MGHESHVDKPAAILEGLTDEGTDHFQVGVQSINLPDNIVPESKPLQDLVQSGYAAVNRPGVEHQETSWSSFTLCAGDYRLPGPLGEKISIIG